MNRKLHLNRDTAESSPNVDEVFVSIGMRSCLFYVYIFSKIYFCVIILYSPQVQAGGLPDLPGGKVLSLEEVERLQQTQAVPN